MENDIIDQNKIDNISNENKKVRINIKDIIKALKLTVFDKDESINKTLKEIRYYLVANNIA